MKKPLSALILFFILGCSGVVKPSSDDTANAPAADAPIAIGTPMKVQRQGGISGLIAMGTQSGPMPPKPGITAAQCLTLTDGGPVKGPDCVTGEIRCGETIVGHTRGGSKLFNTRWYERNFCTPATTQHDGGDERIYHFRFPDDGKWRSRFTLDTPCADLDMAVFTWDSKTCPTGASNVLECEENIKDSTWREQADAVSDGNWIHWMIVIEGKGNEEGAFSLTAQCTKGLG